MTDYLLRIDGITGNSVQRGYEGWFTLLSYRWGVEGSGGGRPDGLPLVVETDSIAGVARVGAEAADGDPLSRVELQVLIQQGWMLKIVLANPKVLDTSIAWSTGEDLITRWTLGEYSRAEISSRSLDARAKWLPATNAVWP